MCAVCGQGLARERFPLQGYCQQNAQALLLASYLQLGVNLMMVCLPYFCIHSIPDAKFTGRMLLMNLRGVCQPQPLSHHLLSQAAAARGVGGIC